MVCAKEPRVIARLKSPDARAASDLIDDGFIALRLGHDGIEQFFGLLFDELEAYREVLDAERAAIDAERRKLGGSQARLAAEQAGWETEQQQLRRLLDQRMDEAENQRKILLAELEAERTRSGQLSHAFNDLQRQFAEHQAAWAAELRTLGARARTECGERRNE
jgi:hypothetical protein